MEETSELAVEQLEQSLSQRVMLLYLTDLGHQPHQVSCKLVDKTLTIVIEDSITRLEQFLAKSNRQEIAKQVRVNLHKALEPHLKALIEEVVKIPVIDLLSDSAFDTNRTSVVAVLATVPALDDPGLNGNLKQEQ
jgi:uncharacterized protein YbcI